MSQEALSGRQWQGTLKKKIFQWETIDWDKGESCIVNVTPIHKLLRGPWTPGLTTPALDDVIGYCILLMNNNKLNMYLCKNFVRLRTPSTETELSPTAPDSGGSNMDHVITVTANYSDYCE